MSDTPIYDATWVDVTLASLFAPLKAKVEGWCDSVPAPSKPRKSRAPRTSATRLAILNDSALIYAMAANA